MRSKARESAFQIIFAEQFNEDYDARFKSGVYKKAELDEDGIAYAERILEAVKTHKEEISALMAEKLERILEYRVFPADRAILYIAIAEVLYFADIPSAVSVSEAAALARKFSTDSSVNFISGVLGGIIQ